MLKQKNKSAVVGATITTFVATIIIIILLVAFSAVSSLFKFTHSISSGVAVYDESKVGVWYFGSYIDGYFYGLTEQRYFAAQKELNKGASP